MDRIDTLMGVWEPLSIRSVASMTRANQPGQAVIHGGYPIELQGLNGKTALIGRPIQIDSQSFLQPHSR